MVREQIVLVWVIGRLDKCREAGTVGGGNYRISAQGRELYESIESHGFLPGRDEVHCALRAMDVPEDQHDWLTSIVMPSY